MLSNILFISEMTKFMELYNRPLSDAVLEDYRQALEKVGINDERFIQAIDAMRFKLRTFPYPVDFIEATYGTAEDRAVKEWTAIADAARMGRTPQLSEHGQKLLTSMGGMSRINMATDNEMGWLRKEFVGNYQATSQIKPQLQLAGAA